MNYLNNNIKILINNTLLNQKLYLSDIYYWFKDDKLENEHIEKIKNILFEEINIEIRDKILLQNLIYPYETAPKKNKIIFKKNN
jgi:hypothetical protein